MLENTNVQIGLLLIAIHTGGMITTLTSTPTAALTTPTFTLQFLMDLQCSAVNIKNTTPITPMLAEP